jgi:hypothetical protein
MNKRNFIHLSDAGLLSMAISLPVTGTPPPSGSIQAFAKRLQPAVRNSGYRDENYWIWCGSVIKGEDDKYHMFASRWTKNVPFSPNWVTNSRIVRSVSDTPEGPYRYVEDVLPPRNVKYFDGRMTHNPTILHIDGQYVLFYAGTTYEEPIPESGVSRELYLKARGNQRIGMATAPSIEGPWTRRDEPVLDVRPDKWDALLTTNPAVTVMPDGRILLLYKSAKGQSSRLLYGAAIADKIEGPYRRLSNEPMFNAANDPKVNVEDLYVWQEDGVLQAVFKDMNGHLSGEKHAGVHAWSTDGINWQLAKPAKAYSRDLRWNDGTVSHQGSLERPQLLIQDGKPTHLFMATTDGALPYWKAEHTFNIAIPLQVKHPQGKLDEDK